MWGPTILRTILARTLKTQGEVALEIYEGYTKLQLISKKEAHQEQKQYLRQ